MIKRYLVTGISFENNNKFNCNVPLIFCQDTYLAKIFIRSHVFHRVNIDYKFVELKDHHIMSTERPVKQPMNIDLIEWQFDDMTNADVIAMLRDSCTVLISDEDLTNADNNLEIAIFDKLIDELDVDFLITIK